jgi:hypothetical protein
METGTASERFAHVRLLPRSLPIIDRLAPSPVSMHRLPPRRGRSAAASEVNAQGDPDRRRPGRRAADPEGEG